jgi:hypothetical protein
MPCCFDSANRFRFPGSEKHRSKYVPEARLTDLQPLVLYGVGTMSLSTVSSPGRATKFPRELSAPSGGSGIITRGWDLVIDRAGDKGGQPEL